jgi:phage tail tape-measure protein
MGYNSGTTKNEGSANRDPITNAPGAHPIGTGIGALAGGAVAGAAAGTVVGPVGTLVGAAVGAVAGGLAGKGIAEQIDPTVEEAYWRENFEARPYAKNAKFEDYAPAYGYGATAYTKYPDRKFEDIDEDLSKEWNAARGNSTLGWSDARPATRDAWNRISDSIERAVPGDSDRDGK